MFIRYFYTFCLDQLEGLTASNSEFCIVVEELLLQTGTGRTRAGTVRTDSCSSYSSLTDNLHDSLDRNVTEDKRKATLACSIGAEKLLQGVLTFLSITQKVN